MGECDLTSRKSISVAYLERGSRSNEVPLDQCLDPHDLDRFSIGKLFLPDQQVHNSATCYEYQTSSPCPNLTLTTKE